MAFKVIICISAYCCKDNLGSCFREHLHRQDSTPKKMCKGTCGHDHHDISHTPTLSESRSSLSLSNQSSLKSRSASYDRDQRQAQELSVIFLLSSTSNKLVDTLENVKSDVREGVTGTISSSSDGEENQYDIVLCHELPKRKLSQEMMIGNMAIVIIVYSDQGELQDILANETGMLGYIRQYWRGYFPLLLIQIGSPGDIIKKPVIEILQRDFSSCFRLLLPDPGSRDKDIEDVVVSYHLHNDKLQCHKVERATSTDTNQSLFETNWKCSGLCGLKSSKIDPLRRKKRSVMDAIRRKMSRNEWEMRNGINNHLWYQMLC